MILKKLCEILSVAGWILLMITIIGCWWLWLWLGLVVVLVRSIFIGLANTVRNMTTKRRIGCTNRAYETIMG
jgi:hypothetical protein